MGCGRSVGPFECCSIVAGDCLEMIPRLPASSIAAIVTDPPYGNGNAGRYGRSNLGGVRTIAGDYDASTYCAAVRLCFRVARPDSLHAFFAGWRRWAECSDVFRAAGFDLKTLVVWDKLATGLGQGILDQHEFIAIARKGAGRETVAWGAGGNVWRFARPSIGKRPEHPHEKPIDLMLRLLQLLPGDPILDPFAGSGSTAVAAARLGRHYLGFELKKDYCAIARRRVAEVQEQPQLFAPAAEQQRLL